MLKIENIVGIATPEAFRDAAIEVFRSQYAGNPLYKSFVDLLKVKPGSVRNVGDIPFLPVSFFKTGKVLTGNPGRTETVFRSSGTTGQTRAEHHVADLGTYRLSLMEGFRRAYGDPRGYCILALLPGYAERGDSSLVYMADQLMRAGGHPLSGFFLDDMDALEKRIETLRKGGDRVLLIGVSHALLRLAERGTKLTEQFIVMETGGMKGMREEMLKSELHALLSERIGVKQIHAEYGMTELLSQAYSKGDGWFSPPPWMSFRVREIDDPLREQRMGRTGGVNVIDLANLHSCAFIATQDLGRLDEAGRLYLMGRYDNSDIRGCNLLVTGAES